MQLTTSTIYPIVTKNPEHSSLDIVLVHGFTQNLEVLSPFASILAEMTGRRVHLVDLAGHGKSSAASLDLAQNSQAIWNHFGQSVFVGYSLGGRVLMHLALQHPTSLGPLVLIGAHPGIAEGDQRLARLYADQQIAKQLRDISSTEKFESFLQEWIASPVFGTLDPALANISARLGGDPKALADSLSMTSLGKQDFLTNRLVEAQVQALYIYGSKDSKFAAIAAELVRLSNGEFTKCEIAQAGHYVIGKDPYATANAIARYISKAP